jgi:hypothetical protein
VVVAIAAHQRIGTVSPEQIIVTGSTIQDVIDAVADEIVIASVARGVLDGGAAVDIDAGVPLDDGARPVL